MGITQLKIVVTVVGFVLIFLTCYWLSRAGQPFNAGVLAIHVKLGTVPDFVTLS